MSGHEFLDSLIVFGPVPSRRLGRSLGVNNIPPKICSYSCVYCQLGRTHHFSSSRKTYYQPEDIFERIKARTDVIIKKGEKIDYITFVPDGEPTLDAKLGLEIDMAKTLGFKTAVITNSSLIGLDCVKNDLMKADLVCFKVDAVQEDIWKKIDRPSKNISLKTVLEGIKSFSKTYKGRLITDTMLCGGLNDDARHIIELASYLGSIGACSNYISTITRPPAENTAKKPSEEKLNGAFQAINMAGGRAELNIGFEGVDFSSSGKAEEGFLSIISVHPMREDAVMAFIKNTGADPGLIEDLKLRGEIVETIYAGEKFFIRKINGPRA
ncbi:MAG: Radical SAM superfamily protein [bacterium ADurb.Bin243]|nr:MAG: Radical SAM superfamily protein [bacterium ADurb.Bin243]HOD42406.1 radical SAM protein [Candidatus Wallbacteria bacterium]